MTNCLRADAGAWFNYTFLTQKERDIETGLDFFGARYYASMQGRFISADSYAGRGLNPQTLNLYSYALNNPLKYVDPTGHQTQKPEKPQHTEDYINEKEEDVLVINHKLSSENLPTQALNPMDLPSPFNRPWTLCPTGNCGGRTIGDDIRTLGRVYHAAQSIRSTMVENIDSVDVSGCLLWVICGGGHLTGDGDAYPDFTPPQSGLVELFVAGAKKAIVHPVPFSASLTVTHIFGPNTTSNRRQFFGGGSVSAGGAIPIGRVPVGPYAGVVYSPSTRNFAVQGGVGTAPQVNVGYSLSPIKPVYSFPSLAWKRKQ